MKYYIVIVLIFCILLTSCATTIENTPTVIESYEFNDSLDLTAFIKHNGTLILNDDIIEIDDTHTVELTLTFEEIPKCQIELMVLVNGFNVPFEIDNLKSVENYVFNAQQTNTLNMTLCASDLPLGNSTVTVVVITDHNNMRRFRTDAEKYYSFGLTYGISNNKQGIDDSSWNICSMDVVDVRVVQKCDYFNKKIKWYKEIYPDLKDYSFEFEKNQFLNNVSGEELNVSITTVDYGLPEENFVELDALTQNKYDNSNIMYLRIEGAPGTYRTSLYCNGAVYNAFGEYQTIEININAGEVLFIPFYAPIYSDLEKVELYALSIPMKMDNNDNMSNIFDSRKINIYYTDEYVPINESSNSISCEVEYLKGAYEKDNIFVLDADELEVKITLSQNYRYYKNQYKLMIFVNNIPREFICDGKEYRIKEVFGTATNEELNIFINTSDITDISYIDVILLPQYNRPMYAYTLLENTNKIFNTDLFVRTEEYVENLPSSKGEEYSEFMINHEFSIFENESKKDSSFIHLYNSNDELSLVTIIEKDTVDASEFTVFVIIDNKLYDFAVIKTNEFLDEYITTSFKLNEVLSRSEVIVGIVTNNYNAENRFVYSNNYIFIEDKDDVQDIVDIEKTSQKIVISHDANQDEVYSSYSIYRSVFGYLAPMLGTGRLTKCTSVKLDSGDYYSDVLGGENMQIALMTNICKTESYDEGIYRFKRQKTTGVAE